MHEIIIHIVRAQADQFLIKILVQPAPVADHVLGKLGRDIDLVPDVIALEDLPDRGLAPRIDISGIEIIHAGPVGRHDLLLRFLQIDVVSLFGETHTAEAQHRQLISIFIFSV